jgi:hypothetical protein
METYRTPYDGIPGIDSGDCVTIEETDPYQPAQVMG